MKILLNRVHQGDPMSGAIRAITDEQWTHAMILIDEKNNLICEAFWPEVRFRILDNSELAGIDAFDVSQTFPIFTPLSDGQVAGIVDYCRSAVAAHEHYSVKGLFDFIPGVSELIGKVRDDGVTCSVFCSQLVTDTLDRGAGLKVLGRAKSSQVAPGYLTWSVLLVPAKALEPLTIGESIAAGAVLALLKSGSAGAGATGELAGPSPS